MSNDLANVPKTDVFFNPDAWAQVQRVAKCFSESALVPPHLQGKVADCIVALAMANEMGENPLVVMQNIFVVKGRAGWSTQYMIARANRSGLLRGRIGWDVTGAGPTLCAVAHATLADTGERIESPRVDMAMAKAEGWSTNGKYATMPEVMLRYRSAAFLIRMYLPDVMLGYHTIEELETLPAAPESPAREVLRFASAPAVPALAALLDDEPAGTFDAALVAQSKPTPAAKTAPKTAQKTDATLIREVAS